MAYQNNGYKRSMKIQIVKHPDDGTPDTTITEDGQAEFIYDGTTYASYIGNDDGFRRLTYIGDGSGTWETRLAAFKLYVQDTYSTSDPGLYESITGLAYRTQVPTIPVYITDSGQDPGQGFVYAYMLVPAEVELTVVAKGEDDTDVTMTILQGESRSDDVEMTLWQSHAGKVLDLSNPTITPSMTNNVMYSVSIIAG